MRRLSCLIFGLAVAGLLHGPAFGQAKKEKTKDSPKKVEFRGPSYKHLDGQLVVFVANGAGGSTAVSDNLFDLNSEHNLRLRIQMVPWAKQDSLFRDLVDQESQINAAARIACTVEAIRKDAPHAHFFFVGQSAGARVVLAAAEMLPAKSVDRVIVLSPAVSCFYDLTRALKTSKYGIDNFYSTEDGILEIAEEKVGTAEGLKTPMAGRVGFRLASSDKKEIEAYRAVRQIRWTQDYCGSGGHFAWTLRHNLKKTVVPMFFCAPAGDCPTIVLNKKPAKK
ncbi:MAG: hypothetical protein HYX68_20075 [Planctomycetes bacterium]|nr:hypothetical protein [Planctomycetota bacterium]